MKSAILLIVVLKNVTVNEGHIEEFIQSYNIFGSCAIVF